MVSDYQQLITLTQLYLLQENHYKDWVITDPEIFQFFKQLTQKEKKVSLPKPPSIKPKAVTPPPVKKEKIAERRETIELVKPKISEHTEWEDIRKIIQQIAPHFPWNDQVPEDTKAKKIKNGWREQHKIPDVLILSFEENKKEKTFLENIALAITQHYCTAKVISAPKVENEQSWLRYLQADHLRLIIACDYSIYGLSHLMEYYREEKKDQKRFLKDTPLLLTNLMIYLKEPKLKASLWGAIQHILSKTD